MKRQLLILFTLAAVLLCMPMMSAHAINGHGHGHRHGHGFGFGSVGFFDDGFDLAELYRELLNNVPYYALHPPVYYSYPVPRTYGYSPFAYPPYVMTPEIVGEVQPLEIINPHVPSTKQAPTKADTDRAVSTAAPTEPLVIFNPFVGPGRSVARNSQ